jgi:2-amino-4-hydroxy-6-hydroxymethyldihydropteridine diphosphokinase
MGRNRRIKNEARVIDLDLLDYNSRVLSQGEAGLVLPHPRMHLRHFVLQPLHDLAPGWRHPVLGKTAEELLQELGGEGKAVRL